MPTSAPPPRSIHTWLSMVLRSIIVLGIAGSIYERAWLTMVVALGILILTLLPSLLGRRLDIHIPPEFELTAILFIFASLFLGEIRDYYVRYWWWDVALHTASGFLLGVLGFLLVYVLNKSPHIDLHMRPGFVAFFAFCFAVTGGALWEIFEYAMDQCFGMNMQKGEDDTMWDLIVDALGALTISVMGYFYLKHDTDSFLQRWIQNFIEKNPRLFEKNRVRRSAEMKRD